MAVTAVMAVLIAAVVTVTVAAVVAVMVAVYQHLEGSGRGCPGQFKCNILSESCQAVAAVIVVAVVVWRL